MKKRTYSKLVTAAIRNFIKNEKWKYHFNAREGFFSIDLCLCGSLMNKIDIIADVNVDHYIIDASCPVSGDPDNKKMMSELAGYICRINQDLLFGRFDLDMDTGMISYWRYIACTNGVPDAETIEGSFYRPIVLYSNYGDGFLDIIAGGAEAKETYRKYENGMFRHISKYCENVQNIGVADDGSFYAGLAELLDAYDSEEEFMSLIESYKSETGYEDLISMIGKGCEENKNDLDNKKGGSITSMDIEDS